MKKAKNLSPFIFFFIFFLELRSDTWCYSGSLDTDGTLIQTSGFGAVQRAVCTFTPNCFNNGIVSFDWIGTKLTSPLAGGNLQIRSYRTAESSLSAVGSQREIHRREQIFPFLHLLPDENLFIFANRRFISFDNINHRIVKEVPVIPGSDRRNYPSTGSSILLILRLTGENQTATKIMICGGAPPEAFSEAKMNPRVFEASRTCRRLRVSDPNPKWVMAVVPSSPRVMPDMLLLPTGDIIIINSAANGTAGWEDATNAVLNPVLYIPDGDPTRRLVILAPNRIPRMYHSTALLLNVSFKIRDFE